ncbi:bifunctional 4-hydroxy-2-oxoglutarate aldolase/2-dehydro-3-deoxy-phosphogluconate aldolase [Shivajiella indica]|uniref:Bifunctional 4-hydroxy-2-oxoglutarate aldolase/2-dehydro-3-deoxy-phosphogluconate aldolase n=1 Tax=Shivajiella indica TaxID=872115 RepID=A0ABW5B3V9_9BACT
MSLKESLSKNRILPAVTIQDERDALPIAEALLKGGLDIMEIAFRSKAAEGAIAQIRKNFPEMTVGAGTLINKEQVIKAVNAGAAFGLAPGFNPKVCRFAMEQKFEMIPGVITPSELENAYEMGFSILKIFPVGQFGGVELLKALNGPYGQLGILYIPMGGVNLGNLSEYLNVKNVIAVGGSWMASGKLVETKNFQFIQENVLQALLKINQAGI